MISRDDLPPTPDWQLPRPIVRPEPPTIPAGVVLGEN